MTNLTNGGGCRNFSRSRTTPRYLLAHTAHLVIGTLATGATSAPLGAPTAGGAPPAPGAKVAGAATASAGAAWLLADGEGTKRAGRTRAPAKKRTNAATVFMVAVAVAVAVAVGW